MRIGICAYWFNRGQGVVARQLRSALDDLGHETFVLARPTRAVNIKPAFVDRNRAYSNDLSVTPNLPIPAYLVGGDYIMSGNDNRDNATYKIDVTLNRSAHVHDSGGLELDVVRLERD